MFRTAALIISLLSLTLSLASCAHAGHVKDEITVTGVVEGIFAIGGETPGWAITLDNPIVVDGKPLKMIEMDPAGRDMEPLRGKRAEATGVIETRRGVERGSYSVLKVGAIREIK